MKTFQEYLKEHQSERIDEGMFDKLFQKAMEKLAVLIGPERMKKLAGILAKWNGKDIDKRGLKTELEGTFKTFKLDKDVSKEIQSESEQVDEAIVDLLIAANYGFWTAIMVKAAIGLGVPVVLAIINAALKAVINARLKKHPAARAAHELEDISKSLKRMV